MVSIKSILQDMKTAVEQGQIQSPDWWLSKAFDLASLWQDLKDELTKYEMLYKTEIVDLIEQGKKISQANLIVEAKSENYRIYCYLNGRDKIVSEMVMLSKKRAQIPNL